MRKLLLGLILVTGTVVHAQYNRSLFYQNGGSPVYQSAMIIEGENVRVFHSGESTEDTLKISWSSIDPLGTITAGNQVELINAAIGSKTHISGVFADGATAYVVVFLTELSPSTQAIGYVRINSATGAVLTSYFPADGFKAGYCETIKNGSELVTYLVSSAAGLSRVGFDPATFSSIATEVVDAAQTASINYNFLRKQSEIALFNGNEHVLYGNTTATLYKRTGASSYSALPAVIPGGQLVDLTLNGSNQLVAATKSDYSVIDNSFSIVTSGTFGGAVATNSASEFVFHDGSYYRMFSQNGMQVATIEKLDAAFALVSTTLLRTGTRFRKAIIQADAVYLTGSVPNASYKQVIAPDGSESDDSAPHAFFSKSSDFTSISDFTEYGQPFEQHDLSFNLGQNNILFAVAADGRHAGKFVRNADKISLLFFAKGMFAGKNPQDELVGTTSQLFESDLLVGPYTTAGHYSLTEESKYNRGFFVTKSMIETHIDSLQTGSADYIAPHGIREWPAHGDPAKGQAEDLAGFVDVDGDGTYEPYDGDYPKIYGDKCFLTLAHQGSEQESSANVEVHTYFYSFNCIADSAYLNTIFVKQQYIPRLFAVDSFYVGTFADPDLGDLNDDYVGTNVALGLVYSYNGTLMDNGNAGLPGFGEKSPAQGLLFLKGSKVANDLLDNNTGIGTYESVNGYGFADGVIDNEHYTLESSHMTTNGSPTQFSDPQSLEEYFNVIRGYHRFGDPQYYDLPADQTVATSYMYPGDTDPLHYGTNGVDPGAENTEESVLNPPGDRRMIGSTGLSALAVGEILEYDFAYICTADSDHVNTSITEPVDLLFTLAGTIKSDFQANEGPCGLNFDFGTIEESLDVKETAKDPFTVYPNPTNGTISINGFGDGNYQVTVYDLNGRLLESKELSKAANSISLGNYSGSLFLVHISNGKQTAIKRVAKN